MIDLPPSEGVYDVILVSRDEPPCEVELAAARRAARYAPLLLCDAVEAAQQAQHTTQPLETQDYAAVRG